MNISVLLILIILYTIICHTIYSQTQCIYRIIKISIISYKGGYTMFKKFKTLAILGAVAFTILGIGHGDASRIQGHKLPDSDFVVAGVPKLTNANAVRQSLGTPTSVGRDTISYGGLTFYISRQYYPTITAKIIKNRDAATARGISVGDTINDVYNAYGKPDFIQNKDGYRILFYGEYIPNSGYLSGINFYTDGNYVREIHITLGDE